MSDHKNLLGNFFLEKSIFDKVEGIISSFKTDSFLSLNRYQRTQFVNATLVELIKSHKARQFLLFEVIDYIHRILENKILEKYDINSLELWMNQFSDLSEEENYRIRALIVGRWIPRDDYQAFFPVGMGKVYEGSHFVTAHGSPDIDTIVASFWGWIDAFSARVAKNLHVWNVPNGPPESSVEVDVLFFERIHPKVFSYFSKSRSQLAVRSFDLMTQQGLMRKKPYENSISLDGERNQNAVVLVDEEGYYRGDWRPFDVESIRQVITSLTHCLKWFETQIHFSLFNLFSKESLSRNDIPPFIEEVSNLSLTSCETVVEFTLRQQGLLQKFLQLVLKVQSGIGCTFKEFMQAAEGFEITDFGNFLSSIKALEMSELFDKNGKLVENRPLIFYHLEKIVKHLNEIFRGFRFYLDTLEVAFRIKTDVFGYMPQFLSHRTDVEEIQNKMGNYPYLTVNVPGPDERQIPMGVIHASALKKIHLGTTTLRDFCNREETKVPAYLEVISVMDHHKSQLNTSSAPTVCIADAQSANVITSEFAMKIHDEYSLCGMDAKTIEEQIQALQGKAKTAKDFRILRRLYQKKEILVKNSAYFVDPRREYLEYFHYLVAILDDTDILTKMTKRDVHSVAALLNKMKTISLRQEVETVNFDEIPRDESYVEKACERLLQNEDLYSVYSVIGAKKENVIAENLRKCANKEPSNLFVDTKIQNGCCRVGQTKIFPKNHKTFEENKNAISAKWLEESFQTHQKNPEVNLHIHMVSTVPGAEELYQGTHENYPYKDQMWLWVPMVDLSVEHLKLFLSAFKNSPKIQEYKEDIEVAFVGAKAKELSQIFQESFLRVTSKFLSDKTEASYAIIYYKAGSLNSRKAMVTPYLPKIST